MRVLEFDIVTSTQDEARKAIDLGESGAFWISATEQSSGRGRRGRVWQGARGNLFASLVLFPKMEQAEWPKYSFVMALALYDALRNFGVETLSLKWPNDVLCENKKISGILLETHKNALIIGVGVNLVDHTIELEDSAISPLNLSHIHGLNPSVLLTSLNDSVLHWESVWHDKGFTEIKSEYMSRATKRLALRKGDGRELLDDYSIDDDGALVAITKTGVERYYSAELVPVLEDENNVTGY